MDDAIKRARTRLDEVLAEVPSVGRTESTAGMSSYLDHEHYTAWRMSALTVIRSLAPNSHFESEWQTIERGKILNAPSKLRAQTGVLVSLRDNFDGGFLADIRGLVRAEVFVDFIEQGQHLFDEGYFQPAAVVTGAVLEDHLRKLSAKHSITLPNAPKLDKMNADLAKAGAYDVLAQKQVTVWADLRNRAAHGKWTEFSKDDVKDMIRGVLRFLNEHPA
jgi:hypothetical protein